MLLSRPPMRCWQRLFVSCIVILAAMFLLSTKRVLAQSPFADASSALGQGQSQPPAAIVPDEKNGNHPHLLSQLGHDFSRVGEDPWFHSLIGIMLAAPAFLQHEDPEFNEQWAGEGTADHVFEFGDAMGNPIFPAAASALSYTVGKLTHSNGAIAFGSDLCRAHLVNALATVSLKGIINRDRPDGSRWGFPSGHTSTAFTSAAVIQTHFGNWWGASAYAAATYVGLSRMQENRHYMSDVIAGAILGTYIGKKISRRPDGTERVMVTPTVGPGGTGAVLTLNF